MSKPYTEYDLSRIFDTDISWRRKELSDLKSAANRSDIYSREPILKAIVAIAYSHWEGYVKLCANKYFEHLALRKKPYSELERQIYLNSILVRLDIFRSGRLPIKEKCKFLNDILDGSESRFSFISPALIDTKSNLNTDTIVDICIVCGIDYSYFESMRSFIDVILLKRRNAIAHGQHENIDRNEMDNFVAHVLSLMEHFRNLLENKIYTKSYAA